MKESELRELYEMDMEESAVLNGRETKDYQKWKNDYLMNTYDEISMEINGEFRVNDFLSLRLEENQTNIYVNCKLFGMCMYLLLEIPKKDISLVEEIDSIDEAADKLDHSQELHLFDDIIPSDTEFWGHCSNIQAWAENNYDTRILRSNLAFPLLKELNRAGDPVAKKVFKEEIVKRFLSGYPSVVLFLFENNYHKELNNEEVKEIYLNRNTNLREFIINSILDKSISRSMISSMLTYLADSGDPTSEVLLGEQFSEYGSFKGASSIQGYILTETEKALLISFMEGRELWIPKSTVRSYINSRSTALQNLVIDDWLLKKNRLI